MEPTGGRCRAVIRALGSAAFVMVFTSACGEGSDPENTSPPPSEPIEISSAEVVYASDQVFDVRDLTLDDEGRVWFITGGEPFIHRVDPASGEHVAQGRRGDGPGELRHPQRFAEDWDDEGELWLYDGQSRRLVRADQDDVHREELPYRGLPRITASMGEFYGDAALLHRIGDSFVHGRYEGGRPPHIGFWSGEVVRLDPGDEEPTPIFDFASLLSAEEASDRFGTAEFMLPIPLWTVCPGGEIVVFDPIGSDLIFVGSTGTVRDSLTIEAPAGPTLTVEEIFEMMFEEVRRASAEAGIAIPEEVLRAELENERAAFEEGMGSGGAPAVDLGCDEAGNLWLRHFDREGGLRGAGRTWSRYDRDGRRRVVTFPERFEVYALEEGRAWGVLFDELDVPRIAAVELPSA